MKHIRGRRNIIREYGSMIWNGFLRKLRFSIGFKITLNYLRIFTVTQIMSAFFSMLILKVFLDSTEFQKIHPIVSGMYFATYFLGIMAIVKWGRKASMKLLYPIYSMTKTVKSIGINDLSTRIDLIGTQDELKDLAITFNDMMDRLEDSVYKQNQFVSDASHELRTPIAVVQGYSNLLLRWGKDDEAVLIESLEAIKKESESMKKLVENLLFLARGDRGAQHVDKLSVDMQLLVEETLKEFQMIDKEHNIYSLELDEGSIIGDSNHLKELIRILVDNAIKYTPEGQDIIINFKTKGKYGILEIQDFGIGISKEDIKNVFDRFYRADKARNREKGGTGLGLSIAKWIVESHEGIINIYSEEGKGTKVIAEFTLEKL